MRRHPRLALVFVASAIAQGTFQGLVILAVHQVLLRLSDAGTVSSSNLVLGAVLIFGTWALRSVSTFAGELAQARLASRVEIELMQRVLAKLVRLSVRFFERSSQGELVMASYLDLRGVRTVTLHVSSIILTLSRLVGLAVVVWVISPKLALIGFVAMPFGMLPAQWLGQRITRLARLQRDFTVTLHDSFLQVSSGIRSVKVHRGEERIITRARAIGEQLFERRVAQARSRSFARLVLDLVSGLGLVMVLVIGARDVWIGALDWPGLLSILIAMMAVYAPALSLIRVFSDIRAAIPSLDRIDEIFDATPEPDDLPHARPLVRVPETIELRDLSFAYDDGQPVLESINATFQKGETIGIVGPSGSGKSTFISLMLRLFEPTQGRILFDGVDLREIRHADLLDMCAVVAQEPFLFIDTVANNIRWAKPDASMDQVVASAKAALIHDEIMQMPEGYDTLLGRHKRGRDLSGGQKQRVCIAAALVKNTPLLFLDEATSNLDSVAEHTVQLAINRLMEGRTTFVVAHRLSTLRGVDRILVLDRGRLAGLGTHDELIETCVAYREPWRYQQQGVLQQ